VGRDRIAATCSDSTSVTKGARRELCKEVTTILDLCDACHHIHNTIGNITKLPDFKFMITTLKAIIGYFGRSVHARAMLRKQFDEESGDEKVRALQKIGKTRFGTFWTAAVSLCQSLSKIRDLVIKGDIKFKRRLVQYIAIVEPFIRSLWSLESSTANAADVYVFWLAIAAHIRELFNKGEVQTGIPVILAEEVINIFNDRHDEFFENDLYFTAFALDPSAYIFL
ncbi:hypothetical protein DENSPDRAFT_788642, partial [Dentipellis sp. KUC8613]